MLNPEEPGRKMKSSGKYPAIGRQAGIALLALCLWSGGCTASLPKGRVTGPKTYRNSVDIHLNGFRRTYLVHVPAGYDAQKRYPLVVVIHGAFDTAAGIEKISGFSKLADREGFIALYPNGFGIFGFLQHWNAGHCCGKAAADNLDDVGFIAKTIEDASRQLSIDHHRIYMVGFSNGGMLTYRFAAERGDLLAAAAPLAASIGGRPSALSPEWRISEPVAPLPLVYFHGLADDDVRFEGGISLHRKGTRTYWSVEKSIAFWVERNGCRPNPEMRRLYRDGISLTLWSQCSDDAEIALYLLKDWGHVWPGKYFTKDLEGDHPLKNFDAAEVIWHFFKRHRREG